MERKIILNDKIAIIKINLIFGFVLNLTSSKKPIEKKEIDKKNNHLKLCQTAGYI